MKQEFVIHVPDLREGSKDYRFDVRREWIDAELGEGEPKIRGGDHDGELVLHAEKTGADVVVTGRLRAPIVVECVRCLGDVRLAVDTEIAVLMTARGEKLRPEADETELTPEEIEREFFAGDDVVLDPMVRENLILEVPMQPRCDDATCPGLRALEELHRSAAHAMGEDAGDAIDPRLAPLAALKNVLADKKD